MSPSTPSVTVDGGCPPSVGLHEKVHVKVSSYRYEHGIYTELMLAYLLV